MGFAEFIIGAHSRDPLPPPIYTLGRIEGAECQASWNELR
jgi:hypothetical protein